MNKIRAVIAVIIGAGLIVFGFVQINDDTVKCGSQVMHEGQVCESKSRRGGSTTERGVEEQRSSNKTSGWLMVGFGTLLLLGGGAFLVMGSRKPKVDTGFPQPVPAQQFGQQPPFPPQQQFGQQPMQQPMQQPYPQQPMQQGAPQSGPFPQQQQQAYDAPPPGYGPPPGQQPGQQPPPGQFGPR